MIPSIRAGALVWMPEGTEDDSGLVFQKTFGIPFGHEVAENGELIVSGSLQGYATEGAVRQAPRLNTVGQEMLDNIAPSTLGSKEQQQAQEKEQQLLTKQLASKSQGSVLQLVQMLRWLEAPQQLPDLF